MPEFPAITHVALTVGDLGRSRAWYGRLFGSDPVIDEDNGPFHHVVWLMGGTLVGIHQFPDLKSSEPLDERRPGLDHLPFACASRSELKEWERRLNDLGVENGGIVDAPYGSGLSSGTRTTSVSTSSLLRDSGLSGSHPASPEAAGTPGVAFGHYEVGGGGSCSTSTTS